MHLANAVDRLCAFLELHTRHPFAKTKRWHPDERSFLGLKFFQKLCTSTLHSIPPAMTSLDVAGVGPRCRSEDFCCSLRNPRGPTRVTVTCWARRSGRRRCAGQRRVWGFRRGRAERSEVNEWSEVNSVVSFTMFHCSSSETLLKLNETHVSLTHSLVSSRPHPLTPPLSFS